MYYFLNNDQLVVYFPSSIASWSKDSPQFSHILELCKEGRWIEVEVLHRHNQMLLENKARVNEQGNVVIEKDGTSVTLDKDTSRLTEFIDLLTRKGTISSEIDRIKPFLRNMFDNPFINAIEELYDYCKAMDFEITSDGCFLAYKNVNADLGSIYDNGKTRHEIGKYTEVEAYDTDRHQVCSKGLHFCSRGYLKEYTGNVTIVVKINPKDVVAIPVDYHYQKGRCRRYLTIGILAEDGTLSTTYDKARMKEKLIQQNKEEQNDRFEKMVISTYGYSGSIRHTARHCGISRHVVKHILHKHNIRSKDED